jgi:transcriptional regulator with XRE-family HTH domain
VAQRLGVTKTIISSYENDLRQPSYDNLLKLASLFKVSTDWLLGNDKSPNYNFSGLTDEQANLVMSLIKEFKKSNR